MKNIITLKTYHFFIHHLFLFKIKNEIPISLPFPDHNDHHQYHHEYPNGHSYSSCSQSFFIYTTMNLDPNFVVSMQYTLKINFTPI